MVGLNRKISSYRSDTALGIAMSDLLIGLVMIGVIFSVAMKFVPHYWDHQAAVGVVERLTEDANSQGADARDLKRLLEKRLKMNNLDHFVENGWVQVIDTGRGHEFTFNYEVRDELMANIDFVIKFEDRFTPAN